MTTIYTDKPYQFTYWINHPRTGNGWSETWFLLDLFKDDALFTANMLLEARRYILAKDLIIELAELRRLDPPFRSIFFPQDPLVPLPQWDYSHNDVNGIMARFEAEGVGYVNHLIRGLENDEIYANEWTRVGAEVFNQPTTAPAIPAAASKLELLQYFFYAFRQYTCHARKTVAGWQLTPWSFVGGGYPSSKPYGRMAQRVSAEWAYWNNAPPFSFCGTVVGVQRECRAVACNPYPTGPNMPIRFYYAKSDALLFPWETIFWGTYRDKKIPTGVVPGEIKGPKHTVANPAGTWEYSYGFSYGDAPGVFPTGTPADFLGMGIKPWADVDDLLIHYGPGCDMPVFSFTVKDINATTVIVSSAMSLGFENSDFIVEQPASGESTVRLRNPSILSGTAGFVTVWSTDSTLGIGTAEDDGTTFKLNGRLRTPIFGYTTNLLSVLSLDPGDHVSVSISTFQFITDVHGIQGGSDGRILLLQIGGGGDFKMKHLSPSGAPLEKIYNPSLTDVVCKGGTLIVLQYYGSLGPWRVMSIQEASATQPGLVNLAPQTMGAGRKSFDSVNVGFYGAPPDSVDLVPGFKPNVYVVDPVAASIVVHGTGSGSAGIGVRQGNVTLGFSVLYDGTAQFSCVDSGSGNAVDLLFDHANFALDVYYYYACRGNIGLDGFFSSAEGDQYTLTGGIITGVTPGGGSAGFSNTELAQIIAIAQTY